MVKTLNVSFKGWQLLLSLSNEKNDFSCEAIASWHIDGKLDTL